MKRAVKGRSGREVTSARLDEQKRIRSPRGEKRIGSPRGRSDKGLFGVRREQRQPGIKEC